MPKSKTRTQPRDRKTGRFTKRKRKPTSANKGRRKQPERVWWPLLGAPTC